MIVDIIEGVVDLIRSRRERGVLLGVDVGNRRILIYCDDVDISG